MTRDEFLNEFCTSYNVDEMEDVCFALDIKADAKLHHSRQSFARNLIYHCERHKMIDKLLAQLKKDRPSTDWSLPPSNPQMMEAEPLQYVLPSDSLAVGSWVYMEEIPILVDLYKELADGYQTVEHHQAIRLRVRCRQLLKLTALPDSELMEEWENRTGQLFENEASIEVGYSIVILQAIHDDFLLKQRVEKRLSQSPSNHLQS